MNLTGLSILLIALISVAGISQQWGAAEAISWWRYGSSLLVLGLAYEWLHIRSLKLSIADASPLRLRLGREESLDLQFSNHSARACVVMFAPGLPAGISASPKSQLLPVPALGQSLASIPVKATELGRWPWRRLPARVQGPLGLGWWPYSLRLKIELSVIPDLVGARGSAAGDLAIGERSSRVGSGPELHHLREYVPGDPRRTVDWKATARAQQLITRVFSEEQHLEIMLVLDVGRTSRTQVDGMSQFAHYVNLAAKFAQHAAACGDQIGLIAAADKPLVVLPPQRGNAAVMGIRQAISELQALPVETDMLGAALSVQKIVKRRCLIVLLTDLYGQSLAGDFGRSLKVWNTRHLPMVVSLIGEDVLTISEQEARTASDPYISLAGREYRESLLHNALGAQRLGAQAIVARPAELQSRVFAEYQRLKLQHRV
jgi:uncharacterized protein (DUF58 family)